LKLIESREKIRAFRQEESSSSDNILLRNFVQNQFRYPNPLVCVGLTISIVLLWCSQHFSILPSPSFLATIFGICLILNLDALNVYTDSCFKLVYHISGAEVESMENNILNRITSAMIGAFFSYLLYIFLEWLY
jgi:hypothetical protein